MAFAAYASRPEFESWAQLADQIDATVADDCLNSATRWIDNYCDRHFWRDGGTGTEVARTFASNCGFDLTIDDLVPGTITTLKTDATGDGVFETTWSASDYQLMPVNRPGGEPFIFVEAVGGQRFPFRSGLQGRLNRVEITGIWGWTAVPAPVKLACLMQAYRIFKARYSPEGQAGVDTFGGVVRVPAVPDPRAITLLDDYKSSGVLIA